MKSIPLGGTAGSHGGMAARVIRPGQDKPQRGWLAQIAWLGFPHKDLMEEIRAWRWKNMPHLWRGLKTVILARTLHIPTFNGSLYAAQMVPVVDPRILQEMLAEHKAYWRAGGRMEFFDWSQERGVQYERLFYGLASLRLVTDVGVGFTVDAYQNSVEAEIMKYHGIGTGTNAENASDTALQTELTTQYQSDNTRATGSLTEGATANIFRTVGTNTVDATVAATEHGILSQAATGGGVLHDRSVFTVINLASGDSLQTTYDWTLSSGG